MQHLIREDHERHDLGDRQKGETSGEATNLRDADIRTAEAEAALLTRKFIDSLPQLILSPLKMAFTREDVTQPTRTAASSRLSQAALLQPRSTFLHEPEFDPSLTQLDVPTLPMARSLASSA
jgi:hypothetical protein